MDEEKEVGSGLAARIDPAYVINSGRCKLSMFFLLHCFRAIRIFAVDTGFNLYNRT